MGMLSEQKHQDLLLQSEQHSNQLSGNNATLVNKVVRGDLSYVSSFNRTGISTATPLQDTNSASKKIKDLRVKIMTQVKESKSFKLMGVTPKASTNTLTQS